MKRHMFVLMLVGLVLTAIGTPIAGLFERHHHPYWFVWPYFALSTATCIAAAVGLLWVSRRRTALFIALWSCMATFLVALFAAHQWPNGDDGPGGAWMLFVVPASAMAAAWAYAALWGASRESD